MMVNVFLVYRKWLQLIVIVELMIVVVVVVVEVVEVVASFCTSSALWMFTIFKLI